MNTLASNRLALASVLAFCLIPFAAAAASFTSGTSGDPLTIDRVMEIIDSKKINTLEELLPELPHELRSSFSLVRESRSLEGATPENPRVILYGNDARFIAAFNGSPTEKTYSDLEMIQFNDQKKAFEFYSLTFPIRREEDGTAVRPERNPALCLSCHGARPHPIWNSYNNWPGLYGQSDDFLEGAERDSFLAFMAHRNENPRYRALEPMLGSAFSPFSYEKRGNMKFRPNVRFGSFLSRLEAQRIASRLASGDRFFPKYSALFAYDAHAQGDRDPNTLCDSLNSPTPILDGLWTPDDARKLHAALEKERLAVAPDAPPIPEAWDVVKDLYFLYSGDLGSGAWTLSREDEDSKDPKKFTEFQNGNSLIRSLVLGQLEDQITAQVPDLISYTRVRRRLEVDMGIQRYLRTPFDVEYDKTLDQMGLELFFASEGQEHCRLLAKEIKKQWFADESVGSAR